MFMNVHTFWPPVVDPLTGTQYVDGAVFINNPAMMALQEARAIWPGRPIGGVLSVGTGRSVATQQTKAGLLYWAGKMLLSCQDSSRVHREVEALLPVINGSGFKPPFYCRLDPVIPNLELDECRKEILDDMLCGTAAFIASKSEEMEQLSTVLRSLSSTPFMESEII